MTSTLGLSDKRKLLLEKMLQKKGMETGTRPAVARRAGSGPAPLSFGQQRLWFLHQLQPGDTAYNIAEAVRLRGPLGAASLESALTEVARRHEVLRTVYAMIDGEPRQIVQPPASVPLPRIVLTGLLGNWLAAAHRETEAARIVRALTLEPFDLARGPVLRAALVELDRDDHVLVLLLHHIATDGWSMGLLVRELTLLYEARSAGASSPFPEPSLQYADFAAWQRGWLQGETLDAQLRYWRERLAGAPTRLALPVDRPWPALQSSHGARTSVALGAETTAALRELAREHGSTLFMVLVSGLAVLLARLTGEDDLLLGTPASGRVRPELDKLIGFFINTLVLRADLTGDPGIPALLARVKETVLGAHAHQDLPFERLIDALELPRDVSHSPLFQVMLAFQNLPAADERPGSLAVLPFPFSAHRAQFELTLSLTDGPGGLFGSLEYRTELFEAATARRLARCFETLLAGMARASSGPVLELPLLSQTEERQLLHEWNDTAVAYAWPRERGGLHHLIEAQAARTPGAVATSFEGESLTCAELSARANQLARHLRSMGCGPETRVAVAMERSVELLVALLGTLKSGAAYVPLDPDYPQERLGYMLDDVRPAVLLTQERLRPILPETTAPVLSLYPDGRESADYDGSNLDETVDDLQFAYIIYTSGSTGRPKGAMVHHAAIRNRLLWMQQAYGLSPADTVLQKTPYSFDVSVWEFFWPLLAGARVAFARPGEHRDPAALAARIAAEGATVLHFVPSMLQLFLEEPGIDGCNSLRRVVASGEALTPELVRRFHERLPGVALENLYGPTEAAVDVTFYPCLPGAEDRSVPIGHPIANTRIHLVDRGGRVVPLGVAGELWIAGVNVGRGYLGRPDLTAEKFVPDPFEAPEGGSRAYRTGDLARRRTDGAIEYLGRIDHQVKLRGVRIELGEIENALLRHPGVREATVVLREDRGVRRLVGYVAPATATAEELRRFLLEHLPEPMVPSRFVGLAALPLSANGKLDRKALPAPDTGAGLSDTEYAPPASPLEEILAEVWGEILNVSPVGARDNFFTLGGDSILSLQVVARLRERGFDLTLQQVFQHQTVRDLAREISASRGGTAPVRTGPFELVSTDDLDRLPPGLEDAYPLARLQAGMVFHSLFDPEASVYHDIFSERLSGPFDEAVLRGSIARVMARHPMLRTSFSLHHFQEPLQLVHREAPVPLTVEDLRQLSAGEQEREVGAWLEAERRRSFDWAQPPLLRFHIHRLDENTFQNSLSFHHSILDGWSAAALRTELMRVYMATLRGENLPELPLDTGFRDFIALERQALESAATREMWQRHLEGATATQLPRWPRPPVESPRGHDHFVSVAPDVVEGLKRAARQAAVPLKSVLCAAHLRVTQLVSGESDVVIGIVANGRPEQEGADQSLGLFLNALPFRLRLGEESWAELAEAAFVLERDMLPHRRFPLAEIQAAHGGQPLFEIVFGVTQFHVYKETRTIGGLEALSSFGYEETNFPLGVNFSLDAEGSQLAVRLNFSDAEIAPEQVRAIGSYFGQALAAIAADPRRPHAEAVLLSEAERRQVVLDGNATERARAAEDLSLHGLFMRQAARTPEAPAVIGDVGEDGVIRYGELAGWAGRIAERLRGLGIGAEDRVGVCLERSGGALAAMLGAMAAGATYVPLDPEWPRERLAAVAADAGLAALLTRSGLDAGVGLAPREVLVEEVRSGASIDPAVDRPWASPASAEAAAYVIYTSGSTGMAKGVVISHRAAANFVLALGETLELVPADRLLLFAPLSFDASVLQIFPVLSRGAAVVVHPNPRELAGPGLPGFCERHGVTVLDLPAALWRQWIDDMAAEGSVLPGEIRTYLTGGESVPTERVHAWAKMARRPAVFLSSYGPTEATVTATVFLTDSGTAPILPTGKVPIGRPLANVRAYVLDARMQPAPLGVAGGLYLAGEGLARGYLGRPELTAAAFLPDTVGGVPGGRLYRTGDLARRLPGSGDLEFLGRADTQVKIRGFRLELSEVEAVLGRHPALAECVVTVREDQPGDRRLVAYAVPQADAAPGVSELRSFLAERLPQYMVPAAFVLLDALPVLGSGKVDRRALPAPESDRPELGSSYAAPSTPAEEALAALWAQVLRLDQVGVHDNFFALGGDSILSIQILARANQMGMRITARQIFEHPTVAELARVAASAPLLDAEQGLVTGAVPLTPIQRWFFAENFAAAHHFNQAVVLDIIAPLDPATLERAVSALMSHHDALRMRFPREDGTPRQENAGAEAAAPLVWIDLSALPHGSRSGARATAQDAVQTSFDLERGPLTRFALFDAGAAGAEGRRLLWAAHHLVIDGVSWRVLIEDLETACRTAALGQIPVLPPKTTSFRAWAERLVGHARSGGFQSELPYWIGVAERGVARLPVDFPDGWSANTVESSHTVGVTLTAEETQALLQLVPSTYRTQINDALLAALARAFAAWTGSPALLVDLEAHGREPLFDDVDLSRTVGWFTTHFPVRLDLDGTADAVAALLAVKEQLRRVPGRGIGHALLVHEGGPEAAPLRTAPPAQVSFNYLGQFDQVASEATLLRLTGEPAGAARHPRAHRTHLIEVIGLVAGGQLRLDLGYSASLHRRETIEQLGASFGTALRELIARSRLGEEVAPTASDFPLIQLKEKSFSKLSAFLDDDDDDE
jgi:amino acid adenylation domain-containing protein/non-ribosomal peptide synthase protein (TIGR01720 family)